VAAATAGGALAVVAAVIAGFVLAGADLDAMPPATPTSTTKPAASVPSTTEATTMPSRTSVSATSLGPPSTAPTQDPRTSSSPTETADPAPPELGYEVIGPAGLRSLRLGQSYGEAHTTGVLGAPSQQEGEGPCTVYTVHTGDGIGFAYFHNDAVQAISVERVQTPEGVGEGWTVQQVQAVYPDLGQWTTRQNGTQIAVASVPGNPQARFRLWFKDGVVYHLTTLELAGHPCF
jgi:hypothetical protein